MVDLNLNVPKGVECFFIRKFLKYEHINRIHSMTQICRFYQLVVETVGFYRFVGKILTQPVT